MKVVGKQTNKKIDNILPKPCFNIKILKITSKSIYTSAQLINQTPWESKFLNFTLSSNYLLC